jgi:hypothetical protein
MTEQRMKVLEMLEANKITVQEAQSLLQALSAQPGDASSPRHVQAFHPYAGVEDEMPEIDLRERE